MKTQVLIIFFVTSLTQLKSQTDTIIKEHNYQGRLIYEGRVLNNKREGEWKFYNDSIGYLYRIENYKNDFPNGEFKEFNAKGILILNGHYSINAIKKYKKKNKELGGYIYSYKPLPVGELMYFNDNGKLIKKVIYSNKGKLIQTLIF